MKNSLLIFMGVFNSLFTVAQVMDTVIVNCPARNQDFIPRPIAMYTAVTNGPIMSKKELKKLEKKERKDGPYVIPDSVLQTTICDSILIKKYNSEYYLKVYDSLGKLRHEGNYKGYKPSGKFISYYNNGKPSMVGQYKIEINNGIQKSVQFGTWITYRLSGGVDKRIVK